MQLSNIPAKIAAIFAASGIKNTIPLTSAGDTLPNNASYDVGFPAITLTPIPSGGLPPLGADFNGIFNEITGVSNWSSAGGLFPYDATFSAQVDGYPKGATLLKSIGYGMWQSNTDNNTTNPDTGGAGWIDPNSLSGAVVGNTRNLKMAITSASASISVTADEIIVENVLGGIPAKLSSFNKTLNLATIGVGGMDTGTAPVSGFVAIYAIYNQSNNTAALLACNASTLQGNIYSGSHMPTGYAFSSLISVWPTNASSLLIVGDQLNRELHFSDLLALTTVSINQTQTALSLSTTVPLNALTVNGVVIANSTSGTGSIQIIVSDSVGTGVGPKYIGGYISSGVAGSIGNFINVYANNSQSIQYAITVSVVASATTSFYINGYTI
jgi:hypothetical protein